MLSIDEVLTGGVAEILPSKEGLASLMEKRKIKLYWGVDPTGKQLHIGHAVSLKKLAQFQKLGHHVIFLIGDFTGMVGDPSGKSSGRKVLTREEVLENTKNYKRQASKILNFEGSNPIEIKFNSEWLGKMSAIEFLNLAKNLTYAQVVERDMFQKRLKEGQDVFMNEFLYPFMQGYDSVAMDVDLEIGGVDQKFNMLMGRKLMRNIKGKEKYVMTLPLLTDGNGNKIGKTEGNAIALDDPPEKFYAKIMALGDNSIVPCFELLTDVEVSKTEVETDPFKYKKKLAFELTKWLNSDKEAQSAQEAFEKTFQRREFSQEAETVKGLSTLVETLASLPAVGSMSQAKRLLVQGAVDVSGETVKDGNYRPRSGEEIKIGKKTFVKIK